jgi:hypothetical protein
MRIDVGVRPPDGEDDMRRQRCGRGAPDEAALGVAGMRLAFHGSILPRSLAGSNRPYRGRK